MSTSSFRALPRPVLLRRVYKRGQLHEPPNRTTPMTATDLADDRSRPTR